MAKIKHIVNKKYEIKKYEIKKLNKKEEMLENKSNIC